MGALRWQWRVSRAPDAIRSSLRRHVDRLLRTGRTPADAVIALTDVYTGTGDFRDAEDAKTKMWEWVGENTKFFPHAAQYEFEAWLIPF